MIKTQEDFFNKIFTSHFICKGSKRVTQGLRVRESWRPNINCNILTAKLMAVNIVSFSFSWCSTGGLGPRCWVMALFTASYQHLLWTPIQSGLPRAPSAGCGFPYHNSSNSSSNSTATQLARRTQLSYIVVRRPLDLWNRMFNRHQAEITVMQFRSHSLPVHQSMSIPWEFFLARPISSANFRPRDFLS